MPIYTIDRECRIKTHALCLDRRKCWKELMRSEIDQTDKYFQ